MEPEALSVTRAGAAIRLRKQYPGRPQRVLRGTVTELSPRPSIQLVSSCKDVLIGEQLNGDALWDERPEQAVVPLVLSALPCGVRVGKENLAAPFLRLCEAGKLAAVVHGNGLDDLRKVLAILRSCTNSRSIQIREPKLPMARQKIAGILCVFQDLSTQPSAIWAAKLGAEAIGTAS